jgi:hypothetical protein
MDALQNLLGHDDFHRLALITTRWGDDADLETQQAMDDREAELLENYWKDLREAGAKVMRYDKTVKSAQTILQQIILNRGKKKLAFSQTRTEINKVFRVCKTFRDSGTSGVDATTGNIWERMVLATSMANLSRCDFLFLFRHHG